MVRGRTRLTTVTSISYIYQLSLVLATAIIIIVSLCYATVLGACNLQHNHNHNDPSLRAISRKRETRLPSLAVRFTSRVVGRCLLLLRFIRQHDDGVGFCFC